MNGPMDPQAAIQFLEQRGINLSDLPQIMAAGQAVTAASSQQRQPAPAAVSRGTGSGHNELTGKPGSENPMPGQPASF